MSVNAEFDRLLKYLEDLIDTKETTDNRILKRVGISKTIYSVIERTIEQELEKEQSKWLQSVRVGLSDKLPESMQGKKRKPRSRIFPFRVTDDLYDNIRFTTKSEIKWYNINISSWVEFKSLHSILTNEGMTKQGKSGGKWVGWLDRVLHSRHKLSDMHGGHFFSFDRMLDNLFQSKRLQSIITTELKKHKKGT